MGSDYMKLVVGLGNPGKKYIDTRHNIGFMFVDSYLNYKYEKVEWKKKFNGLFFDVECGGEKVIFLKPQSFMNLSGDVVRDFIDFYKINFDDVLVISDDLDLLVGNFKLKSAGSSGGHNGLKDIENKIGTSCYKRLKIGISNDKNIDTKNYVLGKINNTTKEKYMELFHHLNTVMDDYFIIPFSDLMAKYNQKNR